jgi:hypothetical protein
MLKRRKGSSQLTMTRNEMVNTEIVSVMGNIQKRPVKKRELIESIKETKIFGF